MLLFHSSLVFLMRSAGLFIEAQRHTFFVCFVGWGGGGCSGVWLGAREKTGNRKWVKLVTTTKIARPSLNCVSAYVLPYLPASAFNTASCIEWWYGLMHELLWHVCVCCAAFRAVTNLPALVPDALCQCGAHESPAPALGPLLLQRLHRHLPNHHGHAQTQGLTTLCWHLILNKSDELFSNF